MQGVKVGPVTAGLLTPESLAELMGGPDIAPVQSDLQTPPGYPNAYNEEPGPAPFIGVPGNPAPIPPPPPGPNVIPGPGGTDAGARTVAAGRSGAARTAAAR